MSSSRRIFKAMITTPFVVELMNGTLRYHKFRHYLEQDEIYLGQFRKALGILADRVEDPKVKEILLYLENSTLESEKDLHRFYLGDAPDMEHVIQSQSCKDYSAHLLRHAGKSPLHISLSALLPCFLMYNEVGKYIFEHSNYQSNKYIEWINTYSSEGFTEDVAKYMDVCDLVAERQNCWERMKMRKIFRSSARLDLLFWEDAYDHR